MVELGTTATAGVASPAPGDLESALAQHRSELTGYCYRMLGSPFEAEDAVQETALRAWRSFDRFEGRASIRSWLYRIATNVCLTMLEGRARRADPVDLGPAATVDSPLGMLPAGSWVEPVPPGGRGLPPEGSDPAEVAVAHETIRLAVVAALQQLPARQRAVLILREVLRWKAGEVAELLGASVASVNSALQRARATLAERDVALGGPPPRLEDEDAALLARYTEAFEQYDIDALVSLLHDEATMSMPPYALWLRGPADLRRWWLGRGSGCRGSRLVPVQDGDGEAVFGQYRPGGADGGFEPWSVQVIESSGGRIVRMTMYLDTERLFPSFGLPARLNPHG
jgi:RNA polymerase sigma-70 factor (ECF subfamily)